MYMGSKCMFEGVMVYSDDEARVIPGRDAQSPSKRPMKAKNTEGVVLDLVLVDVSGPVMVSLTSCSR